MIKISLILVTLASFVLASGGSGNGETDIVPRTINFLIFAAIMYYILAEPVKNFFAGRSDDIASKLQQVQEKLTLSKQSMSEAEEKVAEAKVLANEILEDSKLESNIISEKISLDSEAELEIISKQNDDLMELDQKNMVRDVVDETLNDLLSDENMPLKKEALSEIILKRVA